MQLQLITNRVGTKCNFYSASYSVNVQDMVEKIAHQRPVVAQMIHDCH